MNDTIRLLKSHRTYRDFDNNFKISDGDVQIIIECAKQAPSWMNGQHYSIIEVTGDLKQRIVTVLPEQKQIASCSRFFIFIVDFYRMSLASELNDVEFDPDDNIENLLISSIDLGLSAQNAAIAAESLGYGTCFLGSIRLIAKELIDWLGLPEYTFPIIGLCIGKPNIDMKIKPRLPMSGLFFKNQYETKTLKKDLLDYQQTMVEFAEVRETLLWTEKFTQFYQKIYAPNNLNLMQNQKLLK
ncbi:MAG: NADPH-dependent oxidoreductase [Neisseriaceae bacterium]|nr:MAG: NADPH-dependent oxidoreductase [Neisseriaceae bacterium]